MIGRPTNQPEFVLLVNGKKVDYSLENGYVMVKRTWKNNDKITYQLPMEIKKVISRKEVLANVSRAALQRGPLMYCVEGADNHGQAWNFIAPMETQFSAEPFNILQESVISLRGKVPYIEINASKNEVTTRMQTIRAIPYYTWCNRGSNPMQVWIPTAFKEIKINE